MQAIERPQATQVEDRVDIDEEWIVALAGEFLDATGAVDILSCQGRVAWCRARADIVGHHLSVAEQQGWGSRANFLGDGVVLSVVEIRAVGAGDRERIVQEGR